MSLISTRQIDQGQFQLAVQQYASGAAFSGNFVSYVSASGYLGPLAVVTTGAQTITGVKSFQDSPVVPFSGTTGTAPSRLYVDTRDLTISGVLTGQLSASSSASLVGASGVLAAQTVLASGILSTGNAANTTSITSLSGFTNAMSGQLSAVRVTGSSTIPIANFTGLGGTLVISSGGLIFISGAAGGGASNTLVTGSAAIAAPNFTGVGSVTLTYDGTYVKVSGSTSASATLSGYVESSFVHRYGDELITGVKSFVSSPFVPAPTQPSGAANLSWVSGVSGVLVGQIAPGTTIFTGAFINSGTITGNFIEGSFFCDPVATGLNLFETHIPHSFYLTGAAFACRTTGYGPVNGAILSGKLYQVDLNNTEQTLLNFTFTSGIIYSGSPTLLVLFSGRNRLGLSLTNSLSGIEKFSVGYFGGSYV